MKTHYAYLERGNESNTQDYWSETYCGLDLDHEHLTNDKKYVTCKKCLKALESIRKAELKGDFYF